MSGPKCLSLQSMEYRQEILVNTEKCERVLARYRRLLYEYAGVLDALEAKGKDVSSYDQLPGAEMVTLKVTNLMQIWQWEQADKVCDTHLVRAETALALARDGLRDHAETFFKDLGDAAVQQNAARRDVTTLEAMFVHDGSPASMTDTLAAIRTARSGLMDLATLTPSDTARLAEAQKEIADLRALVASARDTLHQQTTEAHAQSVMQQLGGKQAATGPAPSLQQILAEAAAKRALRTGAPNAIAPMAPIAAGSDAAMRAAAADMAKLDSLLARIAVLSDSAVWQSILRGAQVVRAEEDAVRRRMLLENLMMEGSRLLKQLSEVNAWREQIAQMMDRLDAAPAHADVAAMRSRLEAALRAGQVHPSAPLEKEVSAAITKAREAQERREKRRIVAESLAELGYEPIDGMETAWMEGGKLVVAKPDEDYGVEVVANADASRVQTTMVRFSESTEMTDRQRLADEEREMSWCSDYAEVRRKMSENGLHTAMEMQLPSGAHPVRVVVSPEKAKKRTRSSKAAQLKSGEMG